MLSTYSKGGFKSLISPRPPPAHAIQNYGVGIDARPRSRVLPLCGPGALAEAMGC